MDDLKPCPFCGEEKRLYDRFVPNTGCNVKFIACACGAHGPWADTGAGKNPADEWNRRVAPPEEERRSIPDVPTPEMAKAFWLAFGADKDKLEELVPRPYTGNGDFQVVPRWVAVSEQFHLAEAWKAMLDASLLPQERR